MDIAKSIELSELVNKQIELCKLYEEQRRIAGKAKTDIYILLTSHLEGLRLTKKNIGIEMALLMLMENSVEAKEMYREWQEAESKYKGLEKLIEAYASKISLEQSIMKYVGHGEKWGV